MAWRALASHANVFEQLDWWTLDELEPHTLASADARAALCVAPLQGERCAWVRWAAVADGDSPARALPPLFTAQASRLRDIGVASLRSVARRGEWFTRHLRGADFHKMDALITLEHRAAHALADMPADIVARPADPSDLPAVDDLDGQVFAGMWRYPPEAMVRAHAACALFDVAVYGADVVGYVCATLNRGHAHLIRLAVAPAFERRGIGSGLLDRARRTLLTKGATRVTINTPESFTAIRLYRRLGYRALMDVADIYGRETQ
jgi:GNAT superfamily N-acetyltransferase